MSCYEVLSDGQIQCPYVPSHRVRPGMRLQRHLIKCRTAQLKDKLSPFHAVAINIEICKACNMHIHKARLEKHRQDECKAMRIVVANEVVDNAEPLWKRNMFEDRKKKNNNSDDDWDAGEDWDNDLDNKSYDPSIKVKEQEAKMCLVPVSKTRSEKRMLRAQLRTGNENPYGNLKGNNDTPTSNNKDNNNNNVKNTKKNVNGVQGRGVVVKESFDMNKRSVDESAVKKNTSFNTTADNMEKLSIKETLPSAPRGFGRGHVTIRPPNRPPGF